MIMGVRWELNLVWMAPRGSRSAPELHQAGKAIEIIRCSLQASEGMTSERGLLMAHQMAREAA